LMTHSKAQPEVRDITGGLDERFSVIEEF